jgi:hypothetical protein
MKVLDPGHRYALAHLDGEGEEILQFVKREGEGYPGNVGHCEGTTLQEGLRVFIDRANYVNNQIPNQHTLDAIGHMKMAIYEFEVRAAERHNRFVDFDVQGAVYGEICKKCGHVGCKGDCHIEVANGDSATRSTPQPGLPQGDRNWTVEAGALATNSLPEALREIAAVQPTPGERK